MTLKYYQISILNSPLEPLTYCSKEDINSGVLVDVRLRGRTVQGVVVNSSQKPDFKTDEIENISEFFYASKQLELAKFISMYYICSIGDALSLMNPFSKGQQSSSVLKTASQSIIILSKKQNKALDFLKSHQTSLLFGDTGSGKTEIYMKLFEEKIDKGERSIFLMPEISLTPQMGKRLKEHFGDNVVMWHSKLTPKQRKEAMNKIYDGTAYIIAGPRSALFLPVKNLGLRECLFQ